MRIRSIPPFRRLAAALVALAACSGETMAPPVKEVPGTPGIVLTTALPAADTIGAPLPPLEIVVRDSSGLLARGVPVQLEAITVTPPDCGPACSTEVPTVQFSPDGSAAYARRLTVTTDANGVARAQGILGGIAGEGGFFILARGFTQSHSVNTRAGTVTHLALAPGDTAQQVGNGVRFRVTATDRAGNPRPEDVTLSNPGGELIVNHINLFGLMFATRIGRAEVVATAGSVTARAFLSVVPEGEVVGSDAAKGEVVVMMLSGARRRVFPTPPNTTARDWELDASRVVLLYDHPTQPDRIHLLSVTTGALTQVLIANDTVHGLGHPRFAPDAFAIYFSGYAAGALHPTLWRIDRDGNALVQLVDQADRAMSADAPDPSRDGKYLAYSGHRAPTDGPNDLYLFDLAKGTHTALLHATALMPRWSPQGTGIAYIDAAARPNLINPDGSGRRVIADVAVRALGSWSPDGVWLLAQGDAGWVMLEVATGRAIPLPASITGALSFPLWSPPTCCDG